MKFVSLYWMCLWLCRLSARRIWVLRGVTSVRVFLTEHNQYLRKKIQRSKKTLGNFEWLRLTQNLPYTGGACKFGITIMWSHNGIIKLKSFIKYHLIQWTPLPQKPQFNVSSGLFFFFQIFRLEPLLEKDGICLI